MSVIISLIESVGNFLKQIDGLGWATFAKLAASIALIALAAGAWHAWDIRATLSQAALEDIAEQVANRPLPIPGDGTRKLIKTTFKRDDNVVAFELVSLSLATGSQRTVWLEADDAFGVEHDKLYERRESSQRLFSTYDVRENEKLVAILNGELACLPVHVGVARWSCAISVPPSSSRSRGYYQIWLKREPTIDEVNSYRRDMAVISSHYHDVDVRA